MSALQLHVTPAGHAAIVNLPNSGTNAVVVTQIGVTDQVFTAEGSTVLPGELKRLITFAGAAVADDTIHVTIRDDSADSYTLRGFGLYLADGTLFAVYSHAGETPDYIMQKAAAAMLLLQADVRFLEINATSIAFGNADWLNPPGTETVPGVLELATDAETITGTDDTRAVHPKGLKALLDSRFGLGAPSTFVKGLLTLATAAAIRAAIELKSAALKDEGANNGLDADLLDGQHGAYYLAWANITGKPGTFTPSAHTHVWADISDPPATATRWPSWGEVTGKPGTFAPSAHTHAAADITSGTFDDARIPALAISKITNLQPSLDAKAPSASPSFSGTINFPSNGGSCTVAAGTGDGASYATYNTKLTLWFGLGIAAYDGVVRAYYDARTGTWDAKGGYKVDGQTVWHAGNFNPATIVYDSDTAEAATASKIPIRDGAGDLHARLFRPTYNDQATISGAIAYRVNNTTDSYIRFCSDTAAIRTWLGVPATAHTHTIANVTGLQGALDAKAALSANVTFRDITASRGDGTGVIFLNAANTRYLYFDGGAYQLPGAPLTVGGTVSAPKFARSSSERYKEGIETISPERAAALLSLVRWTEYRMKEDGSYSVGAIAEELAGGPLDFVVIRDSEGRPDSVNYDPLFSIVGASLVGVFSRLEALESRAA